jgi:hypothetical protein
MKKDKEDKVDQGRYRLYVGIGNLLVSGAALLISAVTLGLLVWKVLL